MPPKLKPKVTDLDAALMGRMAMFEVWSRRYGVPMPDLDIYRPMLAALPPKVPRGELLNIVGVALTEKTMRNLDSAGKGPALRFRDEDTGRISYPTLWLLAWLEQRGVTVVVNKAV